MKIIHLVLGKANPERMNGVNKVAHNHATHMTKLGHDVSVWGITHNPVYDFPERNYRTILFKSTWNKWRIDSSLSQALDCLDRDTVFHIHGALIPEFFIVTRKLQIMGIPYVYTPHGAFNQLALMKSRWIKKLYINLIERTMLTRAKKVHFLGGSEFESIEKIVRLKNKVLVPNGQNLEDLSFEYQELQPKTSPIYGFCGRLDSYYKALDMLLMAFANYKSKKGTGIFWIIGDGPDREKLELQVRNLNLEGHVIFLGARFGQEKLNRIANMDVFFHPSRSEGSPTAVLEASGLGVPCVVSTATNMGECIEQYQSGIHLSQNDVQHITHAFFTCENLFYSGELKPMGSRGIEMVRNEFDWMRIAGKLIEVYTNKLT